MQLGFNGKLTLVIVFYFFYFISSVNLVLSGLLPGLAFRPSFALVSLGVPSADESDRALCGDSESRIGLQT